MRIFSILALAFLLKLSGAGWGTDFEDAKKKADKEHKMILLNFSGSIKGCPAFPAGKYSLSHL